MPICKWRKLWSSEKTALCQGLIVCWLCASPRCYNCCGKCKDIVFSVCHDGHGFSCHFDSSCGGWSAVVCHLVSLSNNSLEPRMRWISRVTGACCSVNRKLETAISGSLFFSGTWLVFVDCLCVVSWFL